MLKELFDLVKGNATETVINNPEVPNEHNEAIVAEATNTVASGLRNVVAGGGLQSLLSLFGSGGKDKKSLLSNPIVSMMMGHFAGKLMNKFNLGSSQANNVSGHLIPNVLGSLINKTNEPNESGFSLEKLLGSITGGKSETISSQGGGLHGNYNWFYQQPGNEHLLLFYEYFHGDTGYGLGASHQTGWSALVAELINECTH